MELPKVGDIATGVVVRVYPKYAIMLFESGWTGLLHISEVSNSFVRNFSAFISIGNVYNVKVIEVDQERENVRVSLKQMSKDEKRQSFHHQKINPSEIDFEALEKKLPEWAKIYSNEGDQND